MEKEASEQTQKRQVMENEVPDKVPEKDTALEPEGNSSQKGEGVTEAEWPKIEVGDVAPEPEGITAKAENSDENKSESKSESMEESKEGSTKPAIFSGGTVFGGITPFGGVASFGASSFGKSPTSTGGMAFGSSSSVRVDPAGAKQEASEDTSKSSVFLDMKPPSSTAAPFSFGSSSIKLPTPTLVPPNQAGPSPFGAFSASPFGGASSAANPFGGGAAPAALPLFGSSPNIQRSVPEDPNKEDQPPMADDGEDAINEDGVADGDET
jgi:hypothetical protein